MKLKLKKLKSYSGVVTATKKNPIVEVEDTDVAMSLVKKGYFEIVEDTQGGTDDQEPDGDYQPMDDEIAVENMSLAQLKEIAAQMGIDKNGLKTKADYIAAIGAAADAADETTGNQTMIDLQQA